MLNFSGVENKDYYPGFIWIDPVMTLNPMIDRLLNFFSVTVEWLH